MSMMRLARACLAGAVLCLAGTTAAAAARPPDLPVDIKDNCIPGPEECCEPPTAAPDEPAETPEASTGGSFWSAFGNLLPGHAAVRAALQESIHRFLCGVSREFAHTCFSAPGARAEADEPAAEVAPGTVDNSGEQPRYVTLEEAIALAQQRSGERSFAAFRSAEEWLEQTLGGAMMGCCSARPAQLPLPSGSCEPVLDVEADAAAAAPGQIDATRRTHARRMYRIAERCRRCGDLDMAENCYRETELLCPGCDYAHKAGRRIRQVKAMRAAADEETGEEQESSKKSPPVEKQEGDYTIRLCVPPLDPMRVVGADEVYNAAQRLREQGRALGEPSVSPENVANRKQAKVMYRIAERCRRCGDLDMAEDCYREVKRYCADGVFARKAERRLRKVQAMRAAIAAAEEAAEEQQPAKESAPKEEAKGGASNMNYEVPPPPGVTTVPWPINSLRPEDFPSIGHVKFVFETDAARLAEAKVLYFIGERCRKGGDPDMAYRSYEEANRACPESRHGQKALRRMKQIEEKRQSDREAGEEQEPSDYDGFLSRREERDDPTFRAQLPERMSANEPPVRPCSGLASGASTFASDRGFLEASVGPGELLRLPVLGRLFATARQLVVPAIEIVVEEAGSAAGDDEEEDEYPLLSCGGALPQTRPPELLIPPAVGDLILRDDVTDNGEGKDIPAPSEDLSDWFRQAVRLLKGGTGTLRIDAARLGRLLAQGEEAVHELGCDVVHECGRSYVVYPGNSRTPGGSGGLFSRGH